MRIGPGGDFERGQWPNVERALKSQDWAALTPDLKGAGVEPAAFLPRIRKFCELLLQWNRKVSNLISRNDEPRLVGRHVVESLAPAGWLKENAPGDWMDLGTGGGLPALPLVLAGVGDRWVLVESRRTKCLFLRRVVQEMELKNVVVEQARIEDLVGTPELIGRFQGFTSRATLNLRETLEIAPVFVKPGGQAYLWKGTRFESELAERGKWAEHWSHEETRNVGDEQTVVARFKRL